MIKAGDSPNSIAGRSTRPWFQGLVALVLVVLFLAALRLTLSSDYYPDRFGVVERGLLYRSAQPSGAQVERVCARHGVRTFISLRNCRQDSDPLIAEQRAVLARLGVSFVHIPSETPPGDAQMHEFLEKMRNSEVAKPVLVHCQAGRTRTGAAVALWRVLERGWSEDVALHEAHFFGLHDANTVEMVRDYLALPPALRGKGRLAPLIDRHWSSGRRQQ